MPKNNPMWEMRCYPVQVESRTETRADGESGIITGRPIVYNSWTELWYFDEIIEPGALDGADLTDVRLCLNHDTDYVYARSRRNNPNSTMQLIPNEYGLDIKATLNIEGSPKAQDLWSAISRGDMDKMSFMFTVAEDRWEDLDSDHPKRHITKFRSVMEVSCVTFPAYDTTFIQTSGKDALDSARSAASEDAQRRQSAGPEGADKRSEEIEILKLKNLILGGKHK